MALKYVGYTIYNGSPSGMPTVKAGDRILYMLVGATTLASGYTSLGTTTRTNGLSYRTATKIAATDGEAGPTISSVYGLFVGVWRFSSGITQNANSGNNGVSGVSSILYPTGTLANTDGNSVVAALGVTSKQSATAGDSQSGWTDRVDQDFSTFSTWVMKDSGGGVSSYTGWTQALGVSDVYYNSSMFEIRPEVLACDLTTFAVTVNAATLRFQPKLIADTNVFNATILDIAMTLSAFLQADTTAYNIVVNDVDITRKLSFDPLEFNVTAQVVNIPVVAMLNLDAQSVAIMNGEMTLAHQMMLQKIQHDITPNDIVLMFNGGIPGEQITCAIITQDILAKFKSPLNVMQYNVGMQNIEEIINLAYIPMLIYRNGVWVNGKLRMRKTGAWIKPPLKRYHEGDWEVVT